MSKYVVIHSFWHCYKFCGWVANNRQGRALQIETLMRRRAWHQASFLHMITNMLRPGVNVTLRPARCIRTEPDVALFAVLMESWEPPWEESWRPSGESLRAERARLLGILNTSNADKKHSLSSYSLFRNVPPPHLTPSLLRVHNSPRSRQFPVCALHASPMCRWGCRCVALRESLCFICYHAPSPHVYSNNWSCFGWGLIVFPVKLFWGFLFFFSDCLDSSWENPRERSWHWACDKAFICQSLC